MHKSFKYRLYPTKKQEQDLVLRLDLCRELYNAALQERRDAWQVNRIRVSWQDQAKQVTEVKEFRPELSLVSRCVLIGTLQRLDKAFQAFFCRVKAGQKPGYPRFKGASFYNSLHYPMTQAFRLRQKLYLSQVGEVKIKLHREIQGRIRTLTIKREGTKWFAVCACDSIPENILPKTNKQVGIDVGIESFATLSNGMQISNWRYYEKAQSHLRIAQRRVARRRKGSNRRRKAVAQLRVIHQKIQNQRADFQHKLSTNLIAANDLIAIEKLNVKGMVKNHNLAKSISSVAWSSFFQKLSYKAESAGRKLIEVNPSGTSQTCICGERVEKKLSQRHHECPSCGLSEHRDIVSAKVILQRALGLSVQASTYPVVESVA